MTVSTPGAPPAAKPADLVTATIDGIEISVPKGTMIIRAAEQIGIEIPRFCDHPLLSPVAACRMCLIEIEGQPKPQPACALAVGHDMVIKTQLTSVVADVAQRGVMEFLLINHPLDCPVCDKGGECPLQNQAMTTGDGISRFEGVKRTFPKPIPLSTQVLLDRERCVSCARCTRFADEIAGDPLIELLERGAHQQVGIADDQPFNSYFSGNTVQICPVGALTSTDYRFRARPFDLVSTPTVCEHCASGCALRTDDRNSTVQRRLAWDDPAVNESWNCDKGRFAFTYLVNDRIKTPLVRNDEGDLEYASWPEAIAIVAAKLTESRGQTGFLVGGRLTREDAYAYGKFARVSVGSDDIDFRARPTSQEEHELIASVVAGSGLGVTYVDLETSPMVLLVGLEPEEESPMIFLRLRKGAKAGTTSVAAISSWASGGFVKTGGVVLAAVPGEEASLLDSLRTGSSSLSAQACAVAAKLRDAGSVILIGERLATMPGAISAAVALASDTGASLAWVPRRAGERGAADGGALAGLLPGGRPITDPAARAQVAAVWGGSAEDLPAGPGLSLTGIVEALTGPVEAESDDAGSDEAGTDEAGTDEAAEPRICALVVAGVEIGDLADPDSFRQALMEADFVVNLETRLSAVCAYADVVLPVAVDTERSGSYVDWEGRIRSFGKVVKEASTLTDARVLAMVADAMGRSIGPGDTASLAAELSALGQFDGERPPAPAVAAPTIGAQTTGTAVLATWRYLLDEGILASDEKFLAGTRCTPVARLSTETAGSIALANGDLLAVSTEHGQITLPLVITDMPDGVVWVPMNSPDSRVNEALAVVAGCQVRIARGGSQ